MPRHPFALDARSPSVIVPLTGREPAALDEQAAEVLAVRDGATGAPVVDLVEWRVDLHAPVVAGGGADPVVAVHTLRRLAGLLPGIPLLATFRTTAEGGGAALDEAGYVELVAALAASGLADAVDVEYRHPRAADAIAAAHSHGTPVVASNHDFDATPAEEEIVARLAAMESAGADVAKIAVMPRSAADVLTLLAATERRYRNARIPLVTMAMGALGAVTRIGGGVFGSAATFATVGAASAPGQLPAADVRAALELLGGAGAAHPTT